MILLISKLLSNDSWCRWKDKMFVYKIIATILIVTYQLRQRRYRDREDSDEDSEDNKKSGGSGFKSNSSTDKSNSCIPFEGNVLEYGEHHGIA